MATYNGWTNRETWLVNIHFSPITQDDLDMAKSQIEEWENELRGSNNFLSDFIDLSLINWSELSEEMEEEGEEEEE